MDYRVANSDAARIGHVIETKEDHADLHETVDQDEEDRQDQGILDHGRASLPFAPPLRNWNHCTRSTQMPRKGTAKGMPVYLNSRDAVAVLTTWT